MKAKNAPVFPSFFRYLIATTGFLVTMCFGTLYAWGVFMPHLEAEFGWTRAVVTIPFTVASIFFAFGMIFSGRILDAAGPKPLLVFSAAGVLIGYVLSAYANNLGWLMVSYGVIMGSALSAGYMAVVAGGLKWFPDP